MCSFDFDELQMDARRDYLMKDLKKRCKKRQRANNKNKIRRRRQCKTNGKTKTDSANDRNGKMDSFDEPGGSNHKGRNEVEDLHDNIPKEEDFNSFTKLCDFHNGNHKNHGSSYSNKKEKPLDFESDDQEAVNKNGGDSSDLDHVCADMLQNSINQIKTELNTSKENPQKSGRNSNCIKPQRVTFGNLFKRSRKKCAKKKESEDDIENEVMPSTSGFKENRQANGGDTSDKSEDEAEDVVLYQSKNAGSKLKSRKKQLQINESDDNVEENTNAEPKHKSRRKQSEENNDSDICEEEKNESRRKQAETDESEASEEEEEVGRNADSKQKTRRKQPKDNGSDVSVEEKKSKHKSRRKQPETNESDASAEKRKTRRKQTESNESDASAEEDKGNAEPEHKPRRKHLESDDQVEESKKNGVSKNGESKHKSQRKQPAINESDMSIEEDRKSVGKSDFDRELAEICESDMNVEDSKNNQFQRKLPEVNESDIGLEDTTKRRGKEKDYYDSVNKKTFGKSKSKKNPKISSEVASYLKESKRKRSRSNSSSKRCLCKPSSSSKFDYPKKPINIRNLECECKKLNPKFSLDCKTILAAKQKEQKSAADLCCMCEEILNKRRKRERSGNSECERLLKKQTKKKKKSSSPKLSPSCKKLLKTHQKKKKKISSSDECEKLLKNQERSRSRSSCLCKKPSNTANKKKKRRNSECEKLLKDVRKKKSATRCRPCNMPRRTRTSLPRRRRRSYQAPLLENCGKELKKMNRALSNKIQQKESQLLCSCKKGRSKKKVKCKPEELQVTNCRCASSDLKDRYSKMIEDYHRLKRQYDALKCTNALIEKKLRCFMKKSKCKCTK